MQRMNYKETVQQIEKMKHYLTELEQNRGLLNHTTLLNSLDSLKDRSRYLRPKVEELLFISNSLSDLLKTGKDTEKTPFFLRHVEFFTIHRLLYCMDALDMLEDRIVELKKDLTEETAD